MIRALATENVGYKTFSDIGEIKLKYKRTIYTALIIKFHYCEQFLQAKKKYGVILKSVKSESLELLLQNNSLKSLFKSLNLLRT